MSAIEILADGSMRAAAQMLALPKFARINASTDKHELVTDYLRIELKANLPRYMAEWKDAVDAHMGEAMLRTIMNAQCNEIAVRALTEAQKES